MVELTNQQPLKPAGIDAIVPTIKVRKHFPNLYATRNDTTKEQGFANSICDAVAEVLTKEVLPDKERSTEVLPDKERSTSYRTVQRAWMAYRNLKSPSEN